MSRSRAPAERVTLATRPTPVAAVLLNEKWSYPVFSADACSASHVFCTRCHAHSQVNMLRANPLPGALLPVLVVLDTLTLGGIGCYPGLASGAFACYARTQLRFKYRLESTGMKDMALGCCCAMFATRQQEKELEVEGVVYSQPCSEMR